MKRIAWTTLVGLVAVAGVLVFAVVSGATEGHGIGGSTICKSPTDVGQLVECSYTVRNNSDDFDDTLRAYFVEEVVAGAAGNDFSGNIFDKLEWTAMGAVTCWKDNGLNSPAELKTVAADGAGTAGDPFRNAKYCELPSGSRIISSFYGYHTASVGDYFLDPALHRIATRPTFKAHDLCEGVPGGSPNCPTVPLEVTPGSQTTLRALPAVDIEKATNDEDADSPTGPFIKVGDPVAWTYVVTNMGNVPLSSVTVTDNVIGPITCPQSSLAVGGNMTCTANGVAQSGQYANTGAASGTFDGQTVNDTDPSHYYGAQPALTLVKKTNATDDTCPTVPVGSTVTWTYEVTNTGNVTLTDIEVKDDNGTPSNPADDFTVGTIGSLAAGASTTLTATGTAAAGSYGNVATASTSFAASTVTIPVSATEDDCYFGGVPSIDIEKATNGEDADTATGPIVTTGSTVTWTYVVKNTGNVPLTGVSVTDDKIGAITCPKTALALEESMTCTATGTAQAGQYKNVGTADGTGADTPVTDSDPSHYFGASPELSLVKKTNGTDNQCPTGPIVAVGSAVTWTYEVTNDGNVTLTDILVRDDNGTPNILGDDFTVGTIASLAPQATATLTHNGTAAAGQYTNIATASTSYTTTTSTIKLSDIDNDCYFGANPSIEIEKATNGQDADSPTGPVVAVGSTITWTYVVRNLGNVALTNVTVTDNQLANDATAINCESTGTNVVASLAVGGSATCTATGTAVAGQYANVGTATGTPPVGPDVSDTDPSHYFAPAPSIALVKKTNGEARTCPTGPTVPVGSTVTWTYVVTNTGNVPLSGVTVRDNAGTAGTGDDFNATFVSGDANSNGLLDLTETWTFTASGTATAGQYTNSATAGGTFASGSFSSTVTATDDDCYFGARATIDIEKHTNGQDADTPTGPVVVVGSSINWQYFVTNTSNVTLTNVTVTDNKIAASAISCTPGTGNVIGTMAPGATATCTASGTATEGQYSNIGTASGTPPVGAGVSDTDPSHYFGETPFLPCPAGLFLAGLSTTSTTGDLAIAYDQFPAPNDNSYGANSVGWGPNGRAFKHLTNSDHAGFLILRPNGTTALSFDVDLITATTVSSAAPSGHASLGPFGGDGVIRAGTLTPADIMFDSSTARNLNRTGYFVNGSQTAATKPPVTNGANLLVDSPKVSSQEPDPNTSQYPLAQPNPWNGSYVNEEYNTIDTSGLPANYFVKNVTGWNFHNTYFVTLKAAKLNSLGFDRTNWTYSQFANRAQNCPNKWCVVPNDEQLHNSPEKACPVTLPPPPPASVTVTSKSTNKKTLSVTLNNGTTETKTLSGLSLTWPQATNGNLQSIAMAGTTIYNTSTASPLNIASFPAATASARAISAGASKTLVFTFVNNASTTLANYSGSATFTPSGSVTLLP